MALFGGGKTRTKRIEPPGRKMANAYLMSELARRWSGRRSEGERLADARIRSETLRDIDTLTSGETRALGERGIEGPGQYNRLARGRREGLLGLIGARSAEQIAREQAAPSIAGTLLRENQPYTKTRTKQSGMQKAKPFLKIAGAAAGTLFGGPAGGMAGMQAGGMLADAGGAGEAPTGATQFNLGAGGSAPTGGGGGATLADAGQGSAGQFTLGKTPGQEPGQVTPPEGSAPLGQTGGTQIPGLGSGAKKPGLTGNTSGLQRLQALYGGIG